MTPKASQETNPIVLNKDVQLHYHRMEPNPRSKWDKTPSPRDQVLTFAVNLKERDTSFLKVGVSLNALTENFSRKKGRNIAIGRGFAKFGCKGQYLVEATTVLEWRELRDGSYRLEVNWTKLENAILAKAQEESNLSGGWDTGNLNATIIKLLT